jgi:hypothetical protein
LVLVLLVVVVVWLLLVLLPGFVLVVVLEVRLGAISAEATNTTITTDTTAPRKIEVDTPLCLSCGGTLNVVTNPAPPL